MGVLVILLLGAAVYLMWRGYNRMRGDAENVKECWSNISVVTRKKVSLVNQLITVVSQYQESEKFVMLQVSSDSVEAVQGASARSGAIVAEVGRMAQRFPELKSNQQYNRLMDSIHAAEQDVQQARMTYNNRAKVYNTARTSLPNAFFASALGFGPAEYLTVEAEELPESGVQRQMISEDSERLNRILAGAGTRAVSAARQMGQQGRAMAAKGAEKRAQGGQERAAAGSAEAEGAPVAERFHYVDGAGKPRGPVSRAELEGLRESGVIGPEASVLRGSDQTWTTLGELGS